MHRLYECRYWRGIRSDLTDEARRYEQFAKANVSAKMLMSGDVISSWCRHGSLGVAGRYATCGRAVVQLDVYGGDIPWCGMFGGNFPVKIDVHDIIKRSEM